jgi:hypothetical protein
VVVVGIVSSLKYQIEHGDLTTNIIFASTATIARATAATICHATTS